MSKYHLLYCCCFYNWIVDEQLIFCLQFYICEKWLNNRYCIFNCSLCRIRTSNWVFHEHSCTLYLPFGSHLQKWWTKFGASPRKLPSIHVFIVFPYNIYPYSKCWLLCSHVCIGNARTTFTIEVYILAYILIGKCQKYWWDLSQIYICCPLPLAHRWM